MSETFLHNQSHSLLELLQSLLGPHNSHLGEKVEQVLGTASPPRVGVLILDLGLDPTWPAPLSTPLSSLFSFFLFLQSRTGLADVDRTGVEAKVRQ